jgi:tyrosyl-DNA phosphodiesterase-1
MDEGEPSSKRAKVDDDVIDLTGDDDDVEAGPSAPAPKRDATPAAPPLPFAATTSAQPGPPLTPIAPDCPPLHLFRTEGIPHWGNEGFLGATLQDLVSGPIQWALVSNFGLDIKWLLDACPSLADAPEVVVVHGMDKNDGNGTAMIRRSLANRLPNAVICGVPVPHYGTHHSKFFLLYYEGRGMRVIVHTTNLVRGEIQPKTQALWFQDFGIKDAASFSSSSFERDLIEYVKHLELPAVAAARTLELISLIDCAPARAHLIGSVPSKDNQFCGDEMMHWGHMKLRAALDSEPFDPKFADAPILAQYSSLGSMSKPWLNDFVASLSSGRVHGGNSGTLGPSRVDLALLYLIWPIVQEVQDSLEGWFAGGSLHGTHKNMTQPFLLERYCAFRGSPVGRQRAMPHIKSYLR